MTTSRSPSTPSAAQPPADRARLHDVATGRVRCRTVPRMAGRHRDVAAQETRRPRRLAWIAFAVVLPVLVAGGIVTLIVLRHLDHQYGPIEAGPFGGPYQLNNLEYTKHGRSLRLVDRPGATAEILESLENRGAHSVKITSIDKTPFIADVKWSVYSFQPGGNVAGEDTPWQRFPAMIPAKGSIRLLVTIQRDYAFCSSLTDASKSELGNYFPGNHAVHWESLLASHTTDVTRTATDLGIRIC